MKEKLLCCFILIPYLVFSQTVVSGTLLNENNEGITGASVTITSAGSIIAFAISDANGKYIVSFTNKSGNVQINIRSMGYAPISETIKNEP